MFALQKQLMRVCTLLVCLVAQVINQCLDNDDCINQYETLTSELLEWIEQTIEQLSEREFANTRQGVQQQLAAFNNYRTVEKPPKYVPNPLYITALELAFPLPPVAPITACAAGCSWIIESFRTLAFEFLLD